jgi:hypothetical protein
MTTRLSAVWATLGDNVTLGAVGAVFMIREKLLVVVKPVPSVAVSMMVCVSAERLFLVKEILPFT